MKHYLMSKKKKTPPKPYFLSSLVQNSPSRQEKNKKQEKKRQYREWIQHMSIQSCYFLVVLRISAILWKEDKNKQLGSLCVHYKISNQQFLCV